LTLSTIFTLFVIPLLLSMVMDVLALFKSKSEE